MAVRELLVRLRLDNAQYKAEMAASGRVTDQVTGATGRVGQSLGATSSKFEESARKVQQFHGRMLAVGAAAGVAVAGIMDLANTAGALEQAVGATDTVFKEASGRIDKFAEASVESAGLSERAYREMAARIGGTLKSFGFSVDEAASQTDILIRTGADLAATYGGTTEEAVHALGRAFVGEADPAERFTLNLRASVVNAKAVEMGLAATTSAVDGNARAQATLALITEQSADAAGQFEREMGSLVGTQQTANAEWENAKAALGEKLLPVVTDATNAFSALAGVISEPTSGDSWWAALFDEDVKTILADLLGRTEEVHHELNRVGEASDEAGEAAQRHAERVAEEEEAFKNLSDTLQAATDPLFAVLNASDKLAEAQAKVAAAVAANSDKIVENNVTAAEMFALDMAAAEAAGNLEQAQVDLAYAVANGTVTVDGGIAMLNRWVAAGSITRAQADTMAAAFTNAATQAGTIPGSIHTVVTADMADAQGKLNTLSASLQKLSDTGLIVNPRTGAVVRFAAGGIAAGGVTNRVMIGEAETGGEAFIPKRGISHDRAHDLLNVAAAWHGLEVVALREGGIMNMLLHAGMSDLESIGVAGAPPLSAGIGWQAMWAALSGALPGTRLFSAYRPGAITATGNASLHGQGRAIDVTPSAQVFNWIKGNYGGSKEIIYSPMGGQQVHNGQNHYYGEPTRGDHWCVPLDAEILTRRGWLSYDQVRPGDETPGFNFRTLRTEWTPITHVNAFDAAEVVETGNNRGWTVRSTLGHRWVAWSRSKGYHTTTTAERTHASWVVAAPMVDGPGVDLTYEEAELLGWLITDGSQWEADERCTFEGCTNPARAKGLCGSHREQQRLGKTLRPLRVTHRTGRTAADFSVFVWQTKPAGVARIGAILGDDGSWNGKGYRLRDSYARDLLARARLSHIKNADELRSLVFDMTAPQRQAMLTGVIAGDGKVNNASGSGVQIHGDAGPLLDVETLLAYLCGHRVRVTKRNMPDDIDGWGTQEGRTYRRNGVPMLLSLSRPHVSTAARERRSVGVMPVWCPTTELGSWTMRSGSDVILTMNSHVHWGMQHGGILGGGGGGSSNVTVNFAPTIQVNGADGHGVVAELNRYVSSGGSFTQRIKDAVR